MSKSKTYFSNSENSDINKLVNHGSSNPVDFIFNNLGYYWYNLDSTKNKLEQIISGTQKFYKVKVEIVEEIETSMTDEAILLSSLINQEETCTGNHTPYLWASNDFKVFMTNSNYKDYNHFCIVHLTKPTSQFKKSNMTSKIIEAGGNVGVTASKSKTNKDSYVVFPTTTNNTNNIGIIFFKEAASYAMMRMALQENIKFNPLVTVEYSN